jgi:WD40 repeat-containing protein SMU1
VSGSVDGFVEVWDYELGKLDTTLEYQKQDKIMMHNTSILCLAFSQDSEYLASGSEDGMVKIWRISTGKCVKRLEKAHSKAVTSVAFTSDNAQILSSSHDHLVRLHSLQSGALLKEFTGHSSYVNSAIFSADQTNVISCSSDGTVRVWSMKTLECTNQFSLGNTVHSISWLSDTKTNVPLLLTCLAAPVLHLLHTNGELAKILRNENDKAGNFVACTSSPKGTLIYAVAEDKNVYCFKDAVIINSFTIHTQDVLGISHHPLQNMLATCSKDGTLKIWQP